MLHVSNTILNTLTQIIGKEGHFISVNNCEWQNNGCPNPAVREASPSHDTFQIKKSMTKMNIQTEHNHKYYNILKKILGSTTLQLKRGIFSI